MCDLWFMSGNQYFKNSNFVAYGEGKGSPEKYGRVDF